VKRCLRAMMSMARDKRVRLRFSSERGEEMFLLQMSRDRCPDFVNIRNRY
jgi:hypothetical protein